MKYETFIACTIRQVAEPVGASEMLNTLLSNNVKLLEENVNDVIIKKFIKLIERTGPEKRLLEFFQAICSCRGIKIVSNQENCVRLLYRNVDNRRSLLMEKDRRRHR